jgi:hypothetical protein
MKRFMVLVVVAPMACASPAPTASTSPASTAHAEVDVPAPPVASSVVLVPLSKAQAVAAESSLKECLPRLRRAEGLGFEPADPGKLEYEAALAAELEGKLDIARKGYFGVIQNHPKSAYIPLSYVAFGILFAREAERDATKWEFAKQSFQEVLKFPLPATHQLASFELSIVASNTNDHTGALNHLKNAVSEGFRDPTGPCSLPIAVEARIRTVDVYSRIGRPDVAFNFFATLFPPDQRAGAADLVAELSAVYERGGHHVEAAASVAASLEAREGVTRATCQQARRLADSPNATAAIRSHLDKSLGKCGAP